MDSTYLTGRLAWSRRSTLGCSVLPTSDLTPEPGITKKGGRVNSRPTTGTRTPSCSGQGGPPLQCGGPRHGRPSRQPHCTPRARTSVRGKTRLLSKWLGSMTLGLGVIWLTTNGRLGRQLSGPMPQLKDGVRHGSEASRFPDFWPL